MVAENQSVMQALISPSKLADEQTTWMIYTISNSNLSKKEATVSIDLLGLAIYASALSVMLVYLTSDEYEPKSYRAFIETERPLKYVRSFGSSSINNTDTVAVKSVRNGAGVALG